MRGPCCVPDVQLSSVSNVAYRPLLLNISGEEPANCLCPMPRCLSLTGPGPCLCSPGSVPSLHCPRVFDLGAPEVCGRATPRAGPGDSPRLTPVPRQGRGWCLTGSSPGSVSPRPLSLRCRGARRGPGLPPKQPRQGACQGLLAEQGCAGWQQGEGRDAPEWGPPQSAGGPDSPPSFGDLPHLTEPTLPPGTGHPAPDSKAPQAQAALREAASTPLREIP